MRKRVSLIRKLQDKAQMIDFDADVIRIFKSTVANLQQVTGSDKKCCIDFFTCCNKNKTERQMAKKGILSNYSTQLDIKALAKTTVGLQQALRFLFSKQQRVILAN